jgi:hypothetical protein
MTNATAGLPASDAARPKAAPAKAIPSKAPRMVRSAIIQTILLAQVDAIQ